MAATILAKDVLYRVSAQMTDAPDSARQFVRWSEKELVAWLNDGQRTIATLLPFSCSRVDAIKLAPGTRQSIETIAQASIKPGDGSAPAAVTSKQLLDVTRNMGADGLTAGRSIQLVDRATLDSSNPRWHMVADTEVISYVHDSRTPRNLWVFPAVHATTPVWVEISHMANPLEIPYVADSMRMSGASTVLISIGDQYVGDLVDYMLARAHLKEAEVAGNANIANVYTQKFLTSMNSQVRAMTGVSPNLKHLPMATQALQAGG